MKVQREMEGNAISQYSPYTEYIEQLSGDWLAKFYEATEFSSDRQKVSKFWSWEALH